MPEHPSARRGIPTAITLTSALTLLLGHAPAMAGEVEDVTRAAAGAARTAASAPPDVPSEPTSDDDSEGHETEDPTPPDHASSHLLKLEAGDEEVAVGETHSQIGDNGRSRGHATILRINGMEFFRADSDSRGTREESTGIVGPFCDPSGVFMCFGLGLAQSESRESGRSSSSSSGVGLLELCLFPEGIAVAQENGCGVLVELGVSSSDISRNHRTGRTKAEAFSLLIDLCAGGVDSIEGCGTFLAAIAAAKAPSDSALGQAFRYSCLGLVENGDPECVEDEPDLFCLDSILCVFINQGETFLFVGGAAARQEAMHVALNLSEEISFDLHLVTAEVLARNFGVAAEEETAEAEESALAVTGAQIWVLGLAAACLLAVGSALLAIRRRTAGAAAPA